MSSASLDRRTPTLVLALILGAYLMIILDTSIVITALPSIHRSLHFSATGLTWVQNSYTLTFGGLLLLGARAGDLLGRRRLFSVGIGLFTAASIIGGLAPTAARAARCPQPPGRRRRDRRSGSTRAPHDELPRRAGAHTRDRPLQRRRGCRRQPRPRPRWHAHRMGVLALGPLHQRAGRRRTALARSACPARDAPAAPATSTSPAHSARRSA